MVDTVINVYIPHEERIHFHICYHSIVTFGIRGLCLGFKNTYHSDRLYRFRKSVVDKVKIEVYI